MTASWLGPVKQISYTTDNVDRLVEFWEGLGEILAYQVNAVGIHAIRQPAQNAGEPIQHA